MDNNSDRDRIYADPMHSATEFVFDERVARVFPDMIRRSVPGYATVINLCGVLASRYVKPGTHCYDLGCSLGATTLALQGGIAAGGCRVFGIDNSMAMLEQAKTRIAQVEKKSPSIELICSDVLDVEIRNASMVTLNFTLQFIPLEQRLRLLKNIFNGLNPGGVLVLSEKIAFPDIEEESMQMEMHHAFKRANGYNDLEISQKRSALENVLIPETVDNHRKRLLEAGFRRSDLWFQCFNFVSLVATK
jgi:tRNA (cmo5U34)-methyltransferase